jgi:hypothetical protein
MAATRNTTRERAKLRVYEADAERAAARGMPCRVRTRTACNSVQAHVWALRAARCSWAHTVRLKMFVTPSLSCVESMNVINGKIVRDKRA